MPLHAQQDGLPGGSVPLPVSRTGADIYRAACATCHGADGKGAPASVVGFTTPLPDFTDCAFASAEPDPDWHAVVSEGGPIRALNRRMPAFGDALTPRDIEMAVAHVRTFCQSPAWPRGDLNLPRAFFTEKAFPENEALWTTAWSTGNGASFVNELIYERRLAARNQIEAKVPIGGTRQGSAGWDGGVGDIALAFKRTLHASVQSGSIASAGIEVIFPTGDESSGLGSGDTVFEPFVMWGQMLPRNAFLQMQAGAELPTGSGSSSEVYARAGLGATLAQNRSFGRAWSPQLELLWARPEGGSSEWDIVPQMQVTLSKLQHVSVAVGVRIPLSDRDERSTQMLVYLLWDWFDGGLFEFWK